MKSKAIPMLLVSGLIALSGYARGQSESAASASASGDCKREFEAVRSHTEDAMSFSTEELTAMVKRCDALIPQIQKLNDTQKKVYMKRLAQCRGLFAYVLDSKNKEQK